MDEKKQQELMFKLQMFEQQMQQLQQQMQAVEQGIVELQTLSHGLEELKGKKGKEIMAPIGKGIFARAKLIDEELTVDIGGKNLVKKSIDETKEIMDAQVEKLQSIRIDLEKNLEIVGGEMNGLLVEAQAEMGGDK